MSRKSTYSAEFKAKVVLDLLQGNKELNELASENNLNPNMLRIGTRNSFRMPAEYLIRLVLKKRQNNMRKHWSKNVIKC